MWPTISSSFQTTNMLWNDMDFGRKNSVLEMIRTYLPNTSQWKLLELTGAPKTIISCILLYEEKLWLEWLLRDELQGASQKRKCDGKDPLVENALNEWFSTETARGLSPSGPMLKIKAEEFAKKLNHDSFKATCLLYTSRCV